MRNCPRPNISELTEAGTPIDLAMAKGIRQALLRHKRLGEPVVVWQDGKVVLLPADQIPVTEEDPTK